MTVVQATRDALGHVGVFLPAPYDVAPTADEQRRAAGRLEAAGWRAAWLNEAVGGKDTLVQAGLLLAATDRLVVGTGIANIWARPGQTMHGGSALLASAYPGRFVLGLGVGYPQQAEAVGRAYERPAATMRAYLESMDQPGSFPAPAAPYCRLVAANGPLLLAVAAERADGALPAMRPPAYTGEVRDALGPDRLVVVLVHAPADRSAEALADEVHGHLAAGADHVVLTPDLGAPYAPSIDGFERMAPQLASL